MKRYQLHACTRHHRDARTMARCVWKRAHWVLGTGDYASVSRCRGTTVMLHPTPEAAEAAKRVIDATACGGACVRRHDVIQLVIPGRTVVATGRAA